MGKERKEMNAGTTRVIIVINEGGHLDYTVESIKGICKRGKKERERESKYI